MQQRRCQPTGGAADCRTGDHQRLVLMGDSIDYAAACPD
jgi:hypothetical protein